MSGGSRRRGLAPRWWHRPHRESGSGTVLVVGALVVLVTGAVAALTLVGVVGATHRARTTADLVALAAASDLVRTGSPTSACGRAAALAARSGAVLVDCLPDPASGVVVVSVDVAVPTPARGLGPAHATARAGPGRSP